MRCCAGPDHRDTYDAMFDLWFPRHWGSVITTEDESAGSGVCRPMMSRQYAVGQLLLDLHNQDLAGKDERLVEMIARIVEAYGKYSSSRGPSFSPYQALRWRWTNCGNGGLLCSPTAMSPQPPRNRLPKRLPRVKRSRSQSEWSTPRPAAHKAEQLGREHVQMYGIPLRTLSFSAWVSSCARWVVAPLPHPWHPAGGAAPRAIGSICVTLRNDVHRRRADRPG